MERRFRNQFLDKLIIGCETFEQARLLRSFGTGLSRSQIADFLKIHPGTIRAYESKWYAPGAPAWYLNMLRLLSGDLSIFGHTWVDSRIRLHDEKMHTPYAPYDSFTPRELNVKYSMIHKQNEGEIRRLQAENDKLLKENNKLKADLKRYLIERSENVLEFKRPS